MCTPDKTQKSNQDKNDCCTRNICTFRTWELWCSWKVCYEEQCTEHHPIEARWEMEMGTTDMKRNFHRRLRHEDLWDRSGTSGTTKWSSGCNKGKFADWRAMWLGSEKFFGDVSTQYRWMQQYWLITKARNGAYRTESRKWLREMAEPRRTAKWIRGNITEAIVGFHAPGVQQEKTFQILRGQERTTLCWACHD